MDALPDGIDKYIHKLKILVEDFPDDFIQEELELETPFDLMGCYQSAGPAAVGHLGTNGKRQDTLYLYRRPILDYWASGTESLGDVIAHVLVHEIGHHFGLSDEDMDAIEAAADE